MEWITEPQAWIALITLTALEVVSADVNAAVQTGDAGLIRGVGVGGPLEGDSVRGPGLELERARRDRPLPQAAGKEGCAGHGRQQEQGPVLQVVVEELVGAHAHHEQCLLGIGGDLPGEGVAGVDRETDRAAGASCGRPAARWRPSTFWVTTTTSSRPRANVAIGLMSTSVRLAPGSFADAVHLGLESSELLLHQGQALTHDGQLFL